MEMYGGGVLKLALGGNWASSPPLEQCASTPKKNSWDTIPINPHMFVMELLQWQKVCKIGGDELHRPPRGGLKISVLNHLTREMTT